MVQEKFSALLPTIEKTASAEFGIPSLKARSKMKKRLLKKKRLFPYAGLCGDVRMRLRRESTTADYPRAKLDPDLSEHDAVMLDLLIDTAEAHGCSVVLFVPLGFLFSRFGLTWFWLTYPCTEVLTTLLGARFYKSFLMHPYVRDAGEAAA